MRLESFTILDQILEKGEVKTETEGYLATPKEVYSGQIVVRKEDNGKYHLSLNRLLEQEVIRIINSSLTNKMRRVYQLLGTREPYVIEQMINRIKKSEYDINENSSQAWEALLKTGKYMENTSHSTHALDFMTHYMIVEYECEGYYSPHPEWINKIKKNRTLSRYKVREIIKSDDNVLIHSWMMSIGYKIKNDKYILPKEEQIPSQIFSISKEEKNYIKD